MYLYIFFFLPFLRISGNTVPIIHMFIHVALSCKIQNAVRQLLCLCLPMSLLFVKFFFFLFPFLCVLYELECLTSNKNIFHQKKKKKKKGSVVLTADQQQATSFPT